ncbi:hypothetical protein B0H10DRAFT_1984788 [Mycena sp. CBHHK59/15]|nr:hypothetical protein B0H10DRAFT_1984788 [Mycena sp. CBHHK59/15]
MIDDVNVSAEFLTPAMSYYQLTDGQALGQLSNNIFHRLHTYVLVYSTTSWKSFDALRDIRERLLQIAPHAHLTLVGNRCDCNLDESVVSRDEGALQAAGWGCSFFEVSTFTGEKIQNAFGHVLRLLVQRYVSEIVPLCESMSSKDR